MNTRQAADMVKSRFGMAVTGETEFRGECGLTIEAKSLVAVATYCCDELGFDYLVDICSVDHFGDEPRFEVVYELAVVETGTHLRLKVTVSEDSLAVDSVVSVWPTADWHEREVFDMMGIQFNGHPDLRRIIMWDGYPFHPLRKDFPLEGKPSDVPDTAFTETAPLAGGPFVTTPTPGDTQVREPRARRTGELPPSELFIAEP